MSKTGVIVEKVAVTFLGSAAVGFFCGIVPKILFGLQKLAEEKEIKPKQVLTEVQKLRYDVYLMTKEMRAERLRYAQEEHKLRQALMQKKGA